MELSGWTVYSQKFRQRDWVTTVKSGHHHKLKHSKKVRLVDSEQNLQISNSTQSLMMTDMSCNQMKQTAFIWILESEQIIKYSTSQHSATWWLNQSLQLRRDMGPRPQCGALYCTAVHSFTETNNGPGSWGPEIDTWLPNTCKIYTFCVFFLSIMVTICVTCLWLPPHSPTPAPITKLGGGGILESLCQPVYVSGFVWTVSSESLNHFKPTLEWWYVIMRWSVTQNSLQGQGHNEAYISVREAAIISN